MKKTCEKLNLLQANEGVIRIPFLVKGNIISPLDMSREQVSAVFKNAEKNTFYMKLPEAQIIREPVINRQTMKYTGEYIYQVMPPVRSIELIETDVNKLVHGLYALSVEEILEYLETVLAVLLKNNKLALQVRELCRLTSEYPDAFLDGWFENFQSFFSREAARRMIDNELSFWGKSGSNFLNGWVEVPSQVSPGWLHHSADSMFGKNLIASRQAVKTLVRAMPTRQLHITAGNAPEVPLVSALRAVLTKSAAVIKLPYGATLPGALFFLAAVAAAPEHPITRNLSMVYWQGGDESIETRLFMHNAFDRIVVWGNSGTISSVQLRAPFTKIISLNPRYGVSLIGQEVFSGRLEEAAARASLDVMIDDQKACTASLVHYVEGSKEQVDEYAGMLCKVLYKWDKEMPNFVTSSTIGKIKRMRRGRYANARWYINKRENIFASGVVVMPDEFDILDHPMCRLVVVRPVNKLENALKYLHQGVSTVGVYPEERRFEFRDQILGRGVSNVFPIGQCERFFAGMSHDGMIVLNELVDWKNA